MRSHQSGATWDSSFLTMELLFCIVEVFSLLLEWSMGIDVCVFFWNPKSTLFTGIIRVLFSSQVILCPAIVFSSPRVESSCTAVVSALPLAQGLVSFPGRRGLRSYKLQHQVAFGARTVLTSCPSSDSWSCVPVLSHLTPCLKSEKLSFCLVLKTQLLFSHWRV